MPVKLDLSKAQKKEDTHVQYLPCKIDFCGNAEVDKHFSASVSEEGTDQAVKSSKLSVGDCSW
ncbi:hypothetical protein E2C01_003945 [Portunus trituberculatus]|uniref:Uncharacterized protein n=1 Tax=Portunus trituberculatus TaxID=210409 RepID=A0A5B7CV17_PORTR|nr:hypothetical protein [Portunus trituberculatus]